MGEVANLWEKIDDRVVLATLNKALNMLVEGDIEGLAKKINKADINELSQKLNELDDSKLKKMNIDMEMVKKKIKDSDLKKLETFLGNDAKQLTAKIKELLV